MYTQKPLLIMFIILTMSFIGGVVSNRLFPGPVHAASKAAIVEARVFHLVDENGMSRASLGFDEDKNPALLFRDRDGNNAAFISHTSTGPIIQFMDKLGTTKLHISLDDAGRPSIYLTDGPKKIRAMLSVGSEGQPFLAMTDTNGKPRLMSGLSRNGTPNIIFKSDAGVNQAALMPHQGFGPGLYLMNPQGHPAMGYTSLGTVDAARLGQMKMEEISPR